MFSMGNYRIFPCYLSVLFCEKGKQLICILFEFTYLYLTEKTIKYMKQHMELDQSRVLRVFIQGIEKYESKPASFNNNTTSISK